MIGVGLDLLMNFPTGCLAIPFVYGQEIQMLKLNEFPNTNRSLWYGEISAIKASLVNHSFKITMDDSYYVQILQGHLIPDTRRQFSRRWRPQQNNDPEHKSRLAQQFLFSEVVEFIYWPSNSPDSSPVDNYQTSCEETKSNKSRRIKRGFR